MLRIQLFGQPLIFIGERPLKFRRRKTLALLAYLCMSERPIGRESLATLLSDEATEQLALQGLRNSVADLREQLADHIQVSRQLLAFNRSVPYWLDVEAFQSLAAAADLADQQHAAALYSGDLLAGLSLHNAPLFDSWLAAERQRLRDLALLCLYRQLDHDLAADDLAGTMAVVERVLAINPVSETTYRKAMELLIRHGERDRALQLYERCKAALAAHVRVAPLPETTALYQQMLDGNGTSGAREAASLRVEMPWSRDLATLQGRLANPHCRLVTLLARSESAATALALRAVHYYLAEHNAGQHPIFPDGVFFTALAPTRQNGSTLGKALGTTLAAVQLAPTEVHQSLLSMVSGRSLLLVLDGLLPTEDDAALVAQILRSAPRVKLLVAARERLLLQEEWVLDVEER
jgi:DNA-binding SARP family transcriptional activator